MLEIERKFLVTGEFKSLAYKSDTIIQGYLSSIPQRSVRVRVRGDKAFLTIKGISDPEGLSRFEWEKEINIDEARQLLRLCEPSIISKKRYLVKHDKHIIEVDEFSGDNEGLLIAEIELKSKKESFTKPNWLGKEVTGIEQYYNSSLSKNPFKNWE